MNSILFATPKEHATHVAAEIAALLARAITLRGAATLAVSGGKSPILLFEALAIQSIAWHCVTICLVDERWVASDDERSNEKLVRAHLMQHNAASAKFISVWDAGDTPVAAAATLSAMFAAPGASGVRGEYASGVDVAVLGLGDDGHTASWFPRSRELALSFASLNAYEAVSAEEGREARVTMTLSLIAAARKVLICAAGESKRAVLANAQRDGSAEEFPIRAALRLPNDQVGIRLA